MRNEEHNIQQAIVFYLRFALKDSLIFAVPNGIFFNSNNKKQAFAYMNKLRAEGFVSGVSDIILLYEGKTYFIEVKTKIGRLNPAQMQFKADVERLGFLYIVMRKVADAEKLVKEIKQ
jgi:hypothetical protein